MISLTDPTQLGTYLWTPKIKESQTIVQVWRTQNTEFLNNKYMYRCPFLKTCSLLVKIYMYKDFIYIFIKCNSYYFMQVNGKALMVYIRYNISIELLTLYWKVQNRKVDRDFEGEGIMVKPSVKWQFLIFSLTMLIFVGAIGRLYVGFRFPKT